MAADPSTDPHGLARFVTAQDSGGTYRQALAELRRGRKSGHWMWFVFPQVSGLGSSPAAQRYAISGLDEARAYLAHPVLGPRLLECARALLALPSSDATGVMGHPDDLKLRSSMTLFARADPAGQAFRDVLGQYFGGQEDPRTVDRL
ncbi:DUF1810 domain-containing protein [Kineococcus sp. NUM-3379]